MQVLILGVGSAVPTAKRNPSAQLLEVKGHSYLIDCGEGTQIRLRENKIRLQRIEHIFISHLHGDHYLGLMGLLWTMTLLGRTSEISVYGPPNLMNIIDIHLKAAYGKLAFPLKFISTEVPEGTVILEDERVIVSTIRLKHKIPCTGFLFRESPHPRKLIREQIEKYNIPHQLRNGIKRGKDYLDDASGKLIKNNELTLPPPPSRSFAYCSDTAFDEGVIKQVANVDLLYHEATFMQAELDRARATLHSTSAEAARVAQQAGAKKLVIGHYSNRYDSLEPLVEEAMKVFPNTVAGEEGTWYEI